MGRSMLRYARLRYFRAASSKETQTPWIEPACTLWKLWFGCGAQLWLPKASLTRVRNFGYWSYILEWPYSWSLVILQCGTGKKQLRRSQKEDMFSKPLKEIPPFLWTSRFNSRLLFDYILLNLESSRSLASACGKFAVRSCDICLFASKTTELSIPALRNDKKTPPPLTELAEPSSTTFITIITIHHLEQHYQPSIP